MNILTSESYPISQAPGRKAIGNYVLEQPAFRSEVIRINHLDKETVYGIKRVVFNKIG